MIAGLIGLALVAGDTLGSGGFVFGAIVAGLIVWIVMSQRNPRPAPVTPEEGGYAYGGVPEEAAYTPRPRRCRSRWDHHHRRGRVPTSD